MKASVGSSHQVRSSGRAIVSAAFVIVALVAGLAGTASAAPAAPRACDPAYGCTPPPPPSNSPSCSVSSATAAPGAHLYASITNVPTGTKVTLTFDGTSVGSATTTADGSGEKAAGTVSPAGHLSARQSSASGGAIINFTVPNDAANGPHAIVFTGVGVSCDASPGGLAVEGLSITRPINREPLARTGTVVALLLAIGLALLIVGIQLVRRARSGGRRIVRPQYRVRDYESL